MVILETPIIYLLRYMGVWSEGRAELELSISPELIAGVRDILSKLGFDFHRRLTPVRGVDLTVFVDIEFDLVGGRGLRGYYMQIQGGLWYHGVRRLGRDKEAVLRSLYSELYAYGVELGAFEHIGLDIDFDGGKPREFLWLPIMVILCRMGVIRDTRWVRMELRLVYEWGKDLYLGGGLYRIAGDVLYRREGWFYNEDLRRYKPISDVLVRYEVEGMYRDVVSFWKDFSW